MAQSNLSSGASAGSGSVDIVTRSNGKEIAQYAQGNRVITLTESSVVKIHGDTSLVASYERQGNDLIVHMKDGSTVRYQRFFFIDEHGEHSELVFDDGKTTHHAIFPFADMAGSSTAQTVIPTYETLGDGITTLVGHDGISAGVIGGVLGALAIGGGIALAAGGGGGGHGNNNDSNGDGGSGNGGNNGGNGGNGNGGNGNGNSGGDGTGNGGNGEGGQTTNPTLKVNAFAGDNILNNSESLLSQALSGSTTASNAGRTVTVTLNGKTYTGLVDANGQWSINIPPADLQALPQGSQNINVTLTDSAGHSTTTNVELNVKTTLPELTLDAFAGDNILSKLESSLTQYLSGKTSADNAGQQVTLTLNGKTYTVTVASDGSWRISVASGDLLNLPEGPTSLSVSITDQYGNTSTQSQQFEVKTLLPTINVGQFAGDDTLSGAEAKTAQVLSGSTLNVEAGRVVTILLDNGKSYLATVQSDGSWKVTIPSSDLSALSVGTHSFTVSVSDNANQIANDSHSFNFASDNSSIAISIVSSDDYLSASEALHPLAISGTTVGVDAGAHVTVLLNGKSYDATVGVAGLWTVSIPASDLALLADGPATITATVTDSQGNVVSNQHTLNVLTHDLPAPTIDTPFTDGVLNLQESNQTQTLTGVSGTQGAQVISVTLGGKVYNAMVDAQGNWIVSVPASDLHSFADGPLAYKVFVTDTAGNTGQISGSFNVDTTAPLLSIALFAGDDVLNAAEQNNDQVVSGTASASEQGKLVDVLINGKHYSATVGADGRWSVSVPAADLAPLTNGNYTITATLTDSAGNSTTSSHNFAVKNFLPTVTVSLFAGDGTLDNSEAQTDQILKGTTTNAETGSTITVTLNGQTYTTHVLSNGSWSLTIPSADLEKLPDGLASGNVSVTDLAGQTVNGNFSFNVDADTTHGSIAISIIAGDDFLNVAESNGILNINGTTTNVSAGSVVTVELNGNIYLATVGANGNWQASVNSADLNALKDGVATVTATVTDKDGHSVSATHDLNVLTHTLPNPTIDVPFGDGVLNATEAQSAQTITGKTGITGAGQTITLTLNGYNYIGSVDANGNWSVVVPQADVQALQNGNQVIKVTAGDIAGNQVGGSLTASVDTVAPVITINNFAGDNRLNIQEATQAQTLSGTAVGAEAGQTVTITLNGKPYTATVDSSGNWTTSIPSADLKALSNGDTTISVSVADNAGNGASLQQTISIAADPNLAPLLSVNVFAGNDVLDGTERQNMQTVTGKALYVEAGQVVTVTIGGSSYTGTVKADGTWSVNIPAGALSSLNNGSYTLDVKVSDLSGNSAQASHDFTVNTTASALTVSPLTGDNLVNSAEVASGLVVNGTSVNIPVGGKIEVTLNGITYNATIQAGGLWSVTVPAEAAKVIPDGTATVTVSGLDNAGNPVSSTQNFEIITHTAPNPTLNAPFGDGYLNAAEAGSNQQLSGTTGVAGAGQQVTVNFGGKNYTATVDAQGNWTVNIPSGDFTNLKDGPQPITVTATDAVGNSNNISGSAQIDKTLPVLTINPITGDNVINAAEAHSPIVISGTAPVSDSGQSVVVKVVVNGATYTANVNPDGTWNLTLPAGALNGVSDGNIVFNASLTDVAGNTGTINQVVKLDASAANQPTIHIGTVSGDDYINASEINAPLTISGTSTNVEANQIVTITLNGKTYTTSVNADGSWSYNIPTADVKQLPDGIDGINVSVSDTSGNPATDSHNVTVIAQPADLPTIHVNTVAGDNVINAKEAQSDLQITGTTTHVTNGQTVSVTLGGKTYIGSVDANGLWSVTVPAADVQKLDQGSQNIVANVNDVAKNPASDTHNVQVDTQPPLLSIDLFVTDNVLNYAEALVSQILSGKTDASQTVSVTINNKTVQVTADGNGIWKLTVSAGDLQALPDGTNTITVTATDSAGNTTSKDLSLNVGTHLLPTLTLDTPFVDGILSIVESAAGGVLTGTSTNLLQGTQITITIGSGLNSVQIIGSVGLNGNWSIPVSGHQLDILLDGKAAISVTATDSYGNIGSATGQLDVLTHFEPTATLTLPLFGDNVLNNAEALLGQTLTGNSGLLGAGQTVYITLDGTKYVGAVDANGNWTVQLPSNVLSVLSDSSHTLSVTLTDRAGNTETSSSANFTAKITLPIPTLDTPFGDGILNFVDAQTATSLHGLSGLATNVGVSVIVNINGTPVAAVVNPDGSWTLPLDVGTLQSLPDGTWSLSVTVTDPAGNVVTSPTQTAEVLTHVVPVPTINLPFGDGLLSIAEAGASQILTGSTGITGAGQIVKVTIGTQTLNAVVTTDGQWTLSVLPNALATVTNGPGIIHVEVTDHAGNVGSVNGSFTASLNLPVPTINPLFSDGLLNISEANDTLTLTGKTGSVGPNQVVKLSIDIDGVTYTGVVDGSGNWTVTLPPKALLGIGNGEHEITLTAQDAAGNSATITPAPSFVAYLTPPSVTLNTPFGDGALSISESTVTQTLQGSLTLNNSAVAGSKVIVTINSHDFTATIDPSGTSWSLDLQPGDMTALNLGGGLQDIKVTVTDEGLNTNSSTGQALIALTSPTITVNPNFITDGVIDYPDLHASQTITGGSTGLSVGQSITINIGGQIFTTTVNGGGSWSYTLKITDLVDIPNGSLVVTATDAAGNPAASLPTTYIVDPLSAVPVLTIDPISVDNLLGTSDLALGTVIVSGHSSGLTPLSTLQVTVSGTPPFTLPVVIGLDGSWQVNVPSGTFTEGGHTVTATVIAGLPLLTANLGINVDLTAPTLTVNAFAGNDILNASEAAVPQTLSGTASVTEIGQNVLITLNSKNYSAAVVSDGAGGAKWSVIIPVQDMAALGQNGSTIVAKLADKAGNSVEVDHPILVDTTIPLVSINPISVGGLLNSVNIGLGILLNGSAEPNSSVTIKVGTLAGVTIQTDNLGQWSLNVPKVDLQGLTDGPQVITVTSTDSAGNVSVPVNVGLNVALNQGFGDTLNTLIGGNGVLNLAESLLTQVLTGTVSGNYTGAKVSATILGQLFTADVGNNGKWSINIDPSFWLSSALGKTLDFDLVLTDPNGNIVHTPVHVDLALTDLPLIQNVVAIGDGFLNQLESTANNVVTGTLGNMVAGTTVDVQLGIGTFHATVNANGTWSATIPQNVLAGLQDGSVKVVIIATDPAGNVVTSNTNLSVITHNLPTLVLDPLFGDGVLSLTEALAGGLSIGGSTSGMVGQTLQVLIGGSQVATAVVGANGKWSIVVTPQILGILEGVVGGNVTVEVKGNDVAGNPVDQTVGLKLDLTPPILSGISLFGDGLLNAVDATTNQLITGTATGAPLGSTVNVLIGGKTFTGVTLANGTFSIVLTPANLAQLPDGSLTATVTVTTPSGNTSSTTAGVKVGLTNLPTITLDPLLSGDGFLNKAESMVDQVISGKVTNLTSGTVNITVNGTPLTATINPNGTWSATLKAGLLSGLADGPLNINVSVTDAVGNTSSLPTILTTLTHNLPTITLGSLFGDGVLSVGDLLTSQLISGTTSNLAGGSLTLTLGSKIYTVPVGSGGAWSLSVSPLDLKALLDGNLTVGITAKDAAGNPASASGILSVVTHALPTLTIGSIFGDGGLNIGDLVSAQVISGTSTNAQGSQLTVTLGGKSYLTTVGNDGSWSISVPKTDLSLLGDGNLGVNVSLTNPIGNTTSAGGSLNVITHLPTVGISSGIFGDGILNIAESGVSQLLTGTVTSALPGAKVVVTVGTVDYQATVNANGTWSLNLTSTQLKSLTDGSLHIGVKVTDVVGNTNSTGVDVGIKLSQPLLGLNVVTLPSLGDLLLGGKLLVITGTSKNLQNGAALHVSLLNDTLAADTTVDSNGNWSASLGLTLNLLQLLLLNKVVNLSAHDSAGNGVVVNVGLDGHIIDVTPTSAPAPAMMMAMSIDDVSASHSGSQDHLSQSQSTSSLDDSATTSTSGTFTIGGVTIDLADGTHNSGASVSGSVGNDKVHVSDVGFTHIDGGAGTDTLVLDGSNLNLDLTSLGLKVEHIEIFDLGKAGNNSITLDLKEALNVTDKPQDDLLIKGSIGDRVNLVHGQGDIWDVSGQREVNGVTYDVYHNSSTGSSTLGDVLIQQGLHVNLM